MQKLNKPGYSQPGSYDGPGRARGEGSGILRKMWNRWQSGCSAEKRVFPGRVCMFDYLSRPGRGLAGLS